jgi:hypothetical protein
MRTRRNVAGTLVATVAALALMGCVQSPPRVIPTSDPSTKPVFASDAAALAAAKKAFVGYVAASDAIGNDGGKNPERIGVWVTPSRLKSEIIVFDSFAKTGNRLTGSSKLANFKLQQISQLSRGRVLLSAYVCDDVSGSRLLNAAGADVTPNTRQDVIPFQVTLKNASPNSTRLLVDGSGPWAGTDFCS